ncbi:hypothetical protein EVAR_27775_1 [Eumeta japonica]|uniref:Uncharacterized protein n=1 Tax=Eumeta variegata TaxID=151549 RepID=A0A4C1VD38_EUMVA|nr:hypothetical protein EVAR_27775_1 [Eumeta japonica]
MGGGDHPLPGGRRDCTHLKNSTKNMYLTRVNENCIQILQKKQRRRRGRPVSDIDLQQLMGSTSGGAPAPAQTFQHAND